MRVFLSCLVCRIVTFVLHKLGRGATSMPGKVALKVKRNVLKDLSKNTKVIVVTGTNGKTTSCRILEEGLKKAGKSYFINKSGANLIQPLPVSAKKIMPLLNVTKTLLKKFQDIFIAMLFL